MIPCFTSKSIRLSAIRILAALPLTVVMGGLAEVARSQTYDRIYDSDFAQLVNENRSLLFQRNACAGCNLQGTDLGGLDLSQANLRGANLRETLMIGTNLAGADLSNADLRKAYLWGTNLEGAQLEGTNLCGAIMPSGIKSTVGCRPNSRPNRPILPSRPIVRPNSPFPQPPAGAKLLNVNSNGVGLVSDRLTADRSDIWAVNLFPGPLQVLIESRRNNARFDLIDPSDRVLDRNTGETNRQIERVGQYRIVVRSNQGPASYNLAVETRPVTVNPLVPNRPSARVRSQPFSLGPLTEYGVAVQTVAPGQEDIWSLDTRPTDMRIRLRSEDNAAEFDLIAPDGTIVVSDRTRARVDTIAGNYQIVVRTTGGQETDYRLVVSLN